jgi:outer membrane protein assembly factor BamD (BamD/ComL family)
MGKAIAMVLILAALVVGGCAGDKGKELYETAQFEEKQHNLEHATKLYGEIVSKYPGSEAARKAAERLSALQDGKR